MFCPKCKTEYIPGVLYCADCGEQLVFDLPDTAPADVIPDIDPASIDWPDREEGIVITSCFASEAEDISKLLAQKGIPVSLNHTLSGVIKFHSRPNVNIEILVPVEYAENALEIARKYLSNTIHL